MMGLDRTEKLRVLLVGSPKSILGFAQLARVPNIGLCSIAANLDKADCEVKIVDLILRGRRAGSYFTRLLETYRPHIVGLSCMVFQYAEALELAALAKSWNKNVKVVLGGYHPTASYDEILQGDDMEIVDFVIRGEGEIAMNELVQALRGLRDLSSVAGLSFQDNGSILHNPRQEVMDLFAVKIPDREARIIKRGFHTFGVPADVIETSRGCTYNCNFCSISLMYGRSYRTYEVERVLEDIRDARQRGAKAILIADDNITLDGARYKSLCEAIADARLNELKYSLQASVGGIKRTPGLARAMARSGVKWVFLGIEGASNETLTAMKKNNQFDVSDAEEVVRELKAYNIIVIGGFILGYPEDSEETFWQTLEYARKVDVDIPLFQILTPYPKTAIRDELMNLGLITNEDDYSRYTCYHTNVRTRYLSAQRIRELRDEIEGKCRYESGRTWRLAKEFPFLFARIVPQWLAQKPRELLTMVRQLTES